MDDRSNELGLDDLFSVKGKVVLVTGGSRGIGEMIAAGFLANGAKVYISSRKADVCDATAERLAEEYGGECISLPGDLSERRGHRAPRRPDRRAASPASTSWSTTPGRPGARRSSEFPEVGWDKVMDTNVKGVFFLTQRAAAAARGGAPRPTTRPASSTSGRSTASARRRSTRSPTGRRRPPCTPSPASWPPSSCKRNILVNAIAPGPVPDVDAQHRRRHRRRRRGHRLGRPRAHHGPRPHRQRPRTSPAWPSSWRRGPAAFTVGEVITCDGGIVVSG